MDIQNCLNAVHKRIDDLTKISINHRKNEGKGVLFCDFSQKDNLNVFFISLYSENFPREYLNYYIEKFSDMPASFLFFNIFNDKENMHLEYDIDKNSSYSQKLLNNNNTKDE